MKTKLASLLVLSMITTKAHAGHSEEAFKKLGEACMEQFKVQTYIDRFEKRYIKSWVADEVYEYGGTALMVVKVIQDKKVKIDKWEIAFHDATVVKYTWEWKF